MDKTPAIPLLMKEMRNSMPASISERIPGKTPKYFSIFTGSNRRPFRTSVSNSPHTLVDYPSQILTITIEDKPTIKLINKHGEIMASRFLIPSATYHSLYGNFIDALKANDFPVNFLRSPQHPCTKAYKTYFASYRKRVTRCKPE